MTTRPLPPVRIRPSGLLAGIRDAWRPAGLDEAQLLERQLGRARTSLWVTDLAMLALFGCPQLRVVEDAYAEAAGSAPDWRRRSGLHQLHPLLVHAELFGSGYGRQAVEVAHAYA